MKIKSLVGRTHALFAIILAVSVAGCATSGGKQSTALGNHSAERDLKGTVAEVTSRSQAAMNEMGIKVTDTENRSSGAEQQLSGSEGAHQVSVQIRDIGSGMSRVEVTAKDGQFQWNQDYARTVLDHIISKS